MTQRVNIQYSIEVALQSKLFDEIIVSTEDKRIAEIAKKLGAEVPFYRSEAVAEDKSTLAEVMIDVMDSYKSIGKDFDYYCCIFATAPFITSERLTEAFHKLDKGGYDSVLPLIHYPVPIQQAFKLDPKQNNKAEMFFDDQYGIMTQDYTPAYYDAGQFYWMKPESVKARKRISCDNTGAIVLSELEAHDIDTEYDWRIAEEKYENILKKRNKFLNIKF